jgi:hypothetical protein
MEITIPEGRQIESAPFFLSVHKAGSSLQTGIVEAICSRFGISFLNIPAQLFDQGILPEDYGIDTLTILEKNYVCTGFRETSSLHLVRRYWTAPKRLLLRDPRDVVVSLYFSVLNHPIPLHDGPLKHDMLGAKRNAEQMGVSDFVLAGVADDILWNMRRFIQQAEKIPNFEIRRYEDIIFEKRRWITEIGEQLNVTLSASYIDELLDQFDVFPVEENKNSLIRKVVPGDYRDRLNSGAIEYLERGFEDVFRRLDYPLSYQ